MRKGFCVLDPMFDRKKFAVYTGGLAVLFACLYFFRAEEEPEPATVASSSEADAPQATDYERGYMSGFRAFQNQFGMYVPVEQNVPKGRAYRYTSSHSEDDVSEEGKGYADGYHRAAALSRCPGDGCPAFDSGPNR